VGLPRLFRPDAPDIILEAANLPPEHLDPDQPASRQAEGAAPPSSGSGADSPIGRWLPAAAALVLILVVLGAGILALQATVGDDDSSTATLPTPVVDDYVGQLLADVESDLDDWELDISEERQDGTETGEILDQAPGAGDQLARGEVLALTVSQGPQLRPVPQLLGRTVAEATGILRDANLALGVITQSHDDGVEEGQILAVRVNGGDAADELETGTVVDLVVSAGPAAEPMPSFVGLSLDQAIDQAESLGLILARDEAYSETYPEGVVVDTDPPTDTPVRSGDTVRVVVSLGLPFVTVPDVSGSTPAEAADALTAAGFVVVDTAGPPNQPVIGTSPAAGESHRKGTDIVILTTPA
jgi:serine/threonine-protein kinase